MELIWTYIKKVCTGIMIDEKVTVISTFLTLLNFF